MRQAISWLRQIVELFFFLTLITWTGLATLAQVDVSSGGRYNPIDGWFPLWSRLWNSSTVFLAYFFLAFVGSSIIETLLTRRAKKQRNLRIISDDAAKKDQM